MWGDVIVGRRVKGWGQSRETRQPVRQEMKECFSGAPSGNAVLPTPGFSAYSQISVTDFNQCQVSDP